MNKPFRSLRAPRCAARAMAELYRLSLRHAPERVQTVQPRTGREEIHPQPDETVIDLAAMERRAARER